LIGLSAAIKQWQHLHLILAQMELSLSSFQLLVMLAAAVEASQIGHLSCSAIIDHHQTSQLLGLAFIVGVLQTSLIAN
jgi:hypothetical protein